MKIYLYVLILYDCNFIKIYNVDKEYKIEIFDIQISLIICYCVLQIVQQGEICYQRFREFKYINIFNYEMYYIEEVMYDIKYFFFFSLRG